MKLLGLTVLPYRLPLRRALRTATGMVEQRCSALVCLTDEHGRRGWGDVVCWPGLGSGEAAVQSVMHALPARLEGLNFDGRLESMTQLARDVGGVPEVTGAIEQALLDLLAQPLRLPLHRLLGSAELRQTSVHCLVQDVADATQAARSGYRAYKIKVGAAPVADDVSRVAAIRQAVGPGASLRVDANGAWDVPTAIDAAQLLARHAVDWLEQPVADGPQGLARVRAAGSVRIAADEAVTDAAALTRLVQHQAIDGVTLKPAMLGGLVATRRLVSLALAADLAVCVTHTFDSVIGRSGALHLVAALGLRGPHGLDNPFASDLAPTPTVRDGNIALPDTPGLGVAPRPATGHRTSVSVEATP